MNHAPHAPSSGRPAAALPVPVETVHVETWQYLYLHHYPSPDDPARCNEPSCPEPAPCWYGESSRACLIRTDERLPTPTDVGHPDYPKEKQMPTTTTTTAPAWRRATGCDDSSGSCVEVATLPAGTIAVQSSRFPGVAVTFDGDEWDLFVAGVKAGDFDRAA